MKRKKNEVDHEKPTKSKTAKKKPRKKRLDIVIIHKYQRISTTQKICTLFNQSGSWWWSNGFFCSHSIVVYVHLLSTWKPCYSKTLPIKNHLLMACEWNQPSTTYALQSSKLSSLEYTLDVLRVCLCAYFLLVTEANSTMTWYNKTSPQQQQQPQQTGKKWKCDEANIIWRRCCRFQCSITLGSHGVDEDKCWSVWSLFFL